MATIQERKGKDGKPSFRASIRRKGHPTTSATFTFSDGETVRTPFRNGYDFGCRENGFEVFRIELFIDSH